MSSRHRIAGPWRCKVLATRADCCAKSPVAVPGLPGSRRRSLGAGLGYWLLASAGPVRPMQPRHLRCGERRERRRACPSCRRVTIPGHYAGHPSAPLSLRAVARRLGVSRTLTLVPAIDAGLVRTVGFGKRRRIPLDEFARLVRDGLGGPAPRTRKPKGKRGRAEPFDAAEEAKTVSKRARSGSCGHRHGVSHPGAVRPAHAPTGVSTRGPRLPRRASGRATELQMQVREMSNLQTCRPCRDRVAAACGSCESSETGPHRKARR